jgi:3-hydroxy-9,10-secoandrosta-1,3,5(10)-triene-9,17-dione monooxygenase
MMIERGDFTIEDNWDVVGMRGTGSRRVVVHDLFVPAHRVAPSPLFSKDAPPCMHENPMYRGRVLALLMMELAAVAVGIGYAALDAYEEIMRKKRAGTPLSPLRFEDATFQQIFGHASALLLTAEAALHGIADDYMTFSRRQAEGCEPFSDRENHGLLLVEQQIALLAGSAVDVMFRTGGSSAGKSAEPLQRYMRDMTFLRTHMGLQHELSERGYARLHFGLPTDGLLG